MALKIANNAVSKLAAAVASGDGSITLTAGDGAKFPVLGAGDWHPVTVIKSNGNLEVMKATARTGDVISVDRAQDGTTAIGFSSGDLVQLRWTAGAVKSLVDDVASRVSKGGDKMTGQLELDATGLKFSDGSTLTKAPVAAGAPLRNRFINGDFKVMQLKNPANTVNTGSTKVCTDRWYLSPTGVTASGSNGWGGPNTPAGVPSSPTAMNISYGAGCTALWFGQRIESINIHDLAGKVVTLCGYIYPSSNTTPVLRVGVPTVKDTFTAQNLMSSPPALPAMTAGGWNYFQVNFTVPNTANLGLDIGINLGAVTSGTTGVADMLLIEGDVATPIYPRQDISDMYVQCHRYYRTIPSMSAAGYNAAGNLVYGFAALSEPMRIAPAAAVNSSGITYTNASALAVDVAGTDFIRIKATATATGTAIGTGTIHLDSEL